MSRSSAYPYSQYEGQGMANSRVAVDRKVRSRRGRYVPPVGKVFPRDNMRSEDVAKGQADVLHGVFGRLKSPAKEIANLTGIHERACRNHITGVNCMNLADFFNACRSIPELAEWGVQMMGLTGERQVTEINKGMQAITLRIEANGVKLA